MHHKTLQPGLFLILLSLATPAAATGIQEWLSSEAREELILAFEANDCRLTLTDVSDLLFDYDISDEYIYTERLIVMEPEVATLIFPVVLVKGEVCKSARTIAIEVPEKALDFAADFLKNSGCSVDIESLESVRYPAALESTLSDTDRRNIVSELYNRNTITFRYLTDSSVRTLHAHLVDPGCPK